MHSRILRRLTALDLAAQAQDMDLPGFDFHALRGFIPARYTVHVNGPWCITFEFAGEDALSRRLLRQYQLDQQRRAADSG